MYIIFKVNVAPPEIAETAQNYKLNLLPSKSRKNYECQYKFFRSGL